MRSASSISNAIPEPTLISSKKMDVSCVARRHTALSRVDGIHARMAPLVPINTSAYSQSGAIVTSRRSRPDVGPIIYPWSNASMIVLPDFESNIRLSLFFMPQSVFPSPFAKNPVSLAGIILHQCLSVQLLHHIHFYMHF